MGFRGDSSGRVNARRAALAHGRPATTTILLAALISAACSGPVVEPPRPAWLGEGELDPVRYELDNGLTVILQEDHTAPVVALQAWVAVGSADEREHEAGLAHVHEHMLFKGTATRGVGEIAATVEGSGGNINAWTSYDQTVYHIVTASRYADTALDVLGDAIQRSAFDENELSRELEVIQEEIKRSDDTPGRVLTQSLFRTSFSNHPYGLPIIGSSESVASFTREDVVTFFQRWYRPGNLTLVVVGDFQPDAMRASINDVFGAFDGAAGVRPGRAAEPAQTELRSIVTPKDVQEGHLAVGFHAPGLSGDDVPAPELLSILLGQGESSILFRELKRHNPIATDVYCYLYTPREPGLLMVGANFDTNDDPQDPQAVLAALSEQIFRLREVTVSRRDLRRALTMLESETVYERETVQGRANRLGYFNVVAGDLAFERRFMELARQVTPDEIRRVAREYLRPENMTVAYVLPEALAGTVTTAGIEETVSSQYADVAQLAAGNGLEPDERGVVRRQFPGGLTLLIQEDHGVPLVSVRSVFPGGLRFEDEANNGVNNFVAELLTAGTESRSAHEIAQDIESMAGALGGYSGRNSIGLQLEVLSAHFEEALELFGECLNHSVFPADEVERIRRQILSEIASQDDNLAGAAFRQMHRTLFSEHPFRLDVLGTRETVENLSSDDLRAFYERHLSTSYMTLAVVGDVDAHHVIEAVERVFNVTSTAEPLDVEVPSVPARERVEVTSHRERQQSHLVLAFPSVRVGDDDRYALEVLAAILSGQGGRLFLELRDRQSLAYSVVAFNLVGLDGGYFASYIATSPAKIEEAITGMERELARIQDEPVPDEELGRAQRYLVGQREISQQRVGNRAAYLAFDEAYGLGHDNHYQHSERILAVTPADVQRVARQYLNLETGVLSIIRPQGEGDTPTESESN